MFTLSAPIRRLAWAFVFWPLVVFAQDVTITVNTGTTVRTVDERVFGLTARFGSSYVDSTNTITLLQQADVRTLRISHGAAADRYYWRLSRNRTGDDPNQLFDVSVNPPVGGMNSLARLVTGVNVPTTMVTVNYRTGSPEEAAAWVAYTNAATTSTVAIGTAAGYDWQTAGRWSGMRAGSPGFTDDGMNFLRVGRTAPYGFKYWEIGGSSCYDADDARYFSTQPTDPYVYAQRAKDYIAKMKAVDPTIKVGVIVTASETDAVNGFTRVVTNPRTGVASRGWTAVMLATLRELGVTPDFVSYRRYEQTPFIPIAQGGWENDAKLLQAAKAWPDRAAEIRRLVNDYLGTTEGPKVEILVTEANSMHWQVPGKQSTSLVNGLFLADTVGNILQTEINGMWWWAMRDHEEVDGNKSETLYGWRTYGNLGVLSNLLLSGGSSGTPITIQRVFPTYYALKLLAKFARQGDTVVQATSNHSLLSAFAIKTAAGGVNLLVINKDPDNALNASITVNGFTPAASAAYYTFGKTEDDAAKPDSFSLGPPLVDVAGTTDLTTLSVPVAGSSFTRSFPSYSMTVIALTPPVVTTPAPTTPAPTPSVPSSGGGGGGGGGGAPSLWMIGALGLLALARWGRASSKA